MTAIGWLQAIVFFLIVLALTKPIGRYMARVFEGRADVADARPQARSKVSYTGSCGVREDEEMTVVCLCALDAGFLAHRAGLSLRFAADAEVAAFQPAALRQHGAGLGLEHGGQLYDEYELAVLFRRNRDELSLADGGAGLA